MPLPIQVHEVSSTTNGFEVIIYFQFICSIRIIKTPIERAETLEKMSAMQVYETLPEEFKLSEETLELWRGDWAGLEVDWQLRDWIGCLEDWMAGDNGPNVRYEDFPDHDKLCFERLKLAAKVLIVEIEALKIQHSTA